MKKNLSKESPGLRFLYHTVPGRAILKPLTARWVSRLCGSFLDSPLSAFLIPGFVRNNGIDLDDYEDVPYPCFNDFFCRKIKSEKRPLPHSVHRLMAPCDGLLSAYHITEDTVLPIKQSSYRISDLLSDEEEAARFQNGICLVFRLCVNHYHRYCYPDSGSHKAPVFLPGVLHTVRPIALSALPVFVQNCREYTILRTDHFGTIAQIEVGAMLVGRIVNHYEDHSFQRGEEKGMFQYGGSTIVLLLEADRVKIADQLFSLTDQGIETPVRLGQIIGTEQPCDMV